MTRFNEFGDKANANDDKRQMFMVRVAGKEHTQSEPSMEANSQHNYLNVSYGIANVPASSIPWCFMILMHLDKFYRSQKSLK